MNLTKNKRLWGAAIAVFLIITAWPPLAQAAEGNRSSFKPIAEEVFSSSGVNWMPTVSYRQLKLTVSTVSGAVISKTFDAGSAPYFDLADFGDIPVLDGVYIYEIRMTPMNIKRGVQPDREAEGSLNDANIEYSTSSKAVTQSGAFTIRGGALINSNSVEQRRVRAHNDNGGVTNPHDQVIADDLIVTGSFCVGFDCVNNEVFGFSTILMKENNTRIRFDDTSATAGFPNYDWQLTANDSASGGANKFSIEDITAARVPFTVEGNAPTNALYVDDGGRLGLGTATPVLDVHVINGNTPALRLEQDGSGGYSPQTWDIAGNEANFFVRDVTGGSKLPFRIQPGAPTNSIYMKADGKVGLGTASPDFELEIERTGVNPQLALNRTDGVTAKFLVSASQFQFGSVTNHPIKFLVNGATAMTLSTSSQLGIGINPIHPIHLVSGAHCTAGGVWTNASSISLKENVRNLNSNDALNTLAGLNPVIYNYKNEKEEDYIGFIAEDVPELVAASDRKSLSPMDVVAVLTKVVQEQQQTIAEMKQKIEALEKANKK